MAPKGSLPLTQELITSTYPEPDASVSTFPTYFCKIHSNIIFSSTLTMVPSLHFPHLLFSVNLT